MITTKVHDRRDGVTSYHAERPEHRRPAVETEFVDPDGVRMYESEDGRQFIADTYDRIWGIKKGKVGLKARIGKGGNITYLNNSLY